MNVQGLLLKAYERVTPQRNLTRTILYTLGLLSIAPLFIFLYSSFHSILGPHPVPSFRQVPQRPATPAWKRTPDEYVLDPTWNVNAAPKTRYFNWTVSEVEGSPDGVSRTLIVINGQFPGPVLECNDGDTLIIDINNAGTNSTSLHWHGQYQNGTNFMDGTTGVTNCPIPPGASFRYEFTVRNQHGTYWYHAHFSTQRVDGLFGPFVIHSPSEVQTVPYSTDRVVMLHDHYHDLSAALLPTYLASDNENAEPVPNGALINGHNIIDCEKVDPRYKCNASLANLARFDLERNKNHRLRFINVGAFAEFDVEIDNHGFTLTEVDGVDVQPYQLHRFRINVAQRYSIILQANHPEDSFWLRARMIAHCFAEIPDKLEREVRGIVHYISPSSPDKEKEPLPLPTTTPWNEAMELECKDLDTTELVPAVAVGAPKADLMVRLRSNFEIGGYALSRGFFNSTSWRPSKSPTLLDAIDGLGSGNASFRITNNAGVMDKAFDVKRQLVVKIDGLKTVDVLIDNFDDGNHPFHLHGYKFWILGQGRGYFNMSTYENLNTTNPLRRDTVTIEQYGWVLIRFVADNAGMWAFHCHIAWHAEAGMMMQFLVKGDVVGSWKIPEDVQGLCDNPEKQRGGGIPDEYFYHD